VSARRPDWDRLAPAYDWQLPLERPALRALLGLLDVGEDERLLDAGTGTGALLRELARQGPLPRQAVGLDRSAAILARARPLVPSGWELVRGDAERVPFDDASFDVVTATYLLHLMDADQRARVLGELHRVLKPSGRVGVVTVAPPRSKAGSWLAMPLHAAAKRRGGALAGLLPLDPRPELAGSGFHVTAYRRTGLGYPSLCVVARR
jgi:ubiquinone/menaquinone biosynthesis C-methylase UbiE